ncbi:MAG: GTPase [Planctomycetota bacterium]
MPDTIIAVSSPSVSLANASPGMVPCSMIRLSGPDAGRCADTVFTIHQPEHTTRSASSIGLRPKHEAHRIPATVTDALSEKKWRRIVGRVVWRGNELNAHVYVMPAPRSYTREDVVELHVPGLPWVVETLLDGLIASGARTAQPGEFTRRAFEHGRITLEQAEAVGKLIASSSADEARAHASQLAVHSGVQRRVLKKDIEDLLAQVELGLDFSHEDVIVISLEEMATRLDALRARAVKLADESSHEFERAPATRAPRIVLVGPTNAGKSQLFNTLLKRDAAIVSSERHTTRDGVEAVLKFGGSVPDAVLIDSAGSGDLGGVDAELFSAARTATRRELEMADIVLLALDRSVAMEQQENFAALLKDVKALTPAYSALVWTKSDLAAPANWDAGMQLGWDVTQRFEVSSVSGRGVDALREFLAQRTSELAQRTAQAHAAAGASVRASALSAADALERASGALRDGCGEDVVAVELREAIHAFWRAEGILMRHDAVTEAALDIIFSQFCVGK